MYFVVIDPVEFLGHKREPVVEERQTGKSGSGHDKNTNNANGRSRRCG